MLDLTPLDKEEAEKLWPRGANHRDYTTLRGVCGYAYWSEHTYCIRCNTCYKPLRVDELEINNW